MSPTQRAFKSNCRGRPAGLTISQTAPLELSRLVAQKGGERNFAVLYQVTAGMQPAERRAYGLTQPSDCFYLNQAPLEGK